MQLVEFREEPRTIDLAERGRAAAKLASLAEHLQEGTGRQGIADRVLGKLTPFGTEDFRLLAEAATRPAGYRS